jgi:hypothetical protein
MTLIRWILPTCLSLMAAAPAVADTFTLAPELWDRPRSGRAVLGEPAVSRAVNAYLARPGTRLVIHHPPGTVPVLQAEELRAWLTALAVESEHVFLRSDLEPNAMLTIEVVARP